uniref:Uncharacterized protein n=1 Tax=Avena sativa TaxID=4498 RepID=A0ACD5WY32_AVESA
MDMELDAARHGFGKMGFGCKHYRRRCRIRAPCCNDVFHCRHCHNESTKDGHELDRHAVESVCFRSSLFIHVCASLLIFFILLAGPNKATFFRPLQVICLVCDTEQPIAQVCTNCGVCMGEYFCRTCKFLDDDVDKEQYHCKDCGICRVGGKGNFFHCHKCGSCYSVTLRDKHRCIEGSMKNNCPICYEYLFDSLRETSVLRCGHTMHLQCFHEMLKHHKFTCPMCSVSIFDMEKFLRALDAEIEANLLHTGYMGKVSGHVTHTCFVVPCSTIQLLTK